MLKLKSILVYQYTKHKYTGIPTHKYTGTLMRYHYNSVKSLTNQHFPINFFRLNAMKTIQYYTSIPLNSFLTCKNQYAK